MAEKNQLHDSLVNKDQIHCISSLRVQRCIHVCPATVHVSWGDL